MSTTLVGEATHVMRFAADERSARRVSDLLFEQLDPSEAAVSAFESSGGWLIEVHFATAPDRERMAILVQEACGGTPEISFERIAVTDWVANSLAGLKPVQVGRFVIHGAHDRARVRPNQIGVEIEAALAFGTGHHGTTQGCLAAIDVAARIKRPRRVLDLGAGTGVLAIAAARAFRRPVVAGDIDRWAVLATKVNVRANRVGALVRAVHADGVRHPAIRNGGRYDFVLANILLAPLKRLAQPVRGLLAPGATVVLSGLNPEHANAALSAWARGGLVLRRRQQIDNWVSLILERPRRSKSK